MKRRILPLKNNLVHDQIQSILYWFTKLFFSSPLIFMRLSISKLNIFCNYFYSHFTVGVLKKPQYTVTVSYLLDTAIVFCCSIF